MPRMLLAFRDLLLQYNIAGFEDTVVARLIRTVQLALSEAYRLCHIRAVP